jgi:hypothetical protein
MTKKSALKLVKMIFERRSSVRYQNQERYEKEGHEKYKKGYEIRLIVSEEEYAEVNSALELLGFYPGKPYFKGVKQVIPIYGREDFILFMELIGAKEYLYEDMF